MPENNKKVSFLKRLSFKKVLYPSIFFIFILSVILVFFFLVKFIASNIDKVFYVPSDSEIASQVVSFDKADYLIVAKKLGISTVEQQPANVNIPEPETSKVETTPVATSTPAVIDKKMLKIVVYNSTGVSGLAAKLKSILVGGGFVVAETGTTPPALATTTVKIKETLFNSSVAEEIKNLVSSKYQIISEILNAASTFDVEIVIGNK